MSEIKIGLVDRLPPQLFNELNEFMFAETGHRPEEVRMHGLAGPNHFLQFFLIDMQPVWVFLGPYTAGKILDAGIDVVFAHKKEFVKLIAAAGLGKLKVLSSIFRKIRNEGYTVSLAVHVPGSVRNAGWVFSSDDDEEFAWHLLQISNNAKQIQSFAAKLVETSDPSLEGQLNPDCSLIIEVDDDGTISLQEAKVPALVDNPEPAPD